jgi:DNA-binding NarL/FixJ family response regulator
MPNRHRILIVDDDHGLREALTEQLSLYEEFEAVAVENGIKGVQAAKAGQIDLVIMGCRSARHRRSRGRACPAQERLQGSNHHADRARL